MNVVKSFNLPSHKNQFIAYGTFEEQKSMRFTDVCVHKHRFIIRAYNKVKYRVKKKFSTDNRDEHKGSALPLIIKKWSTDYESNVAK